MSESEARWDRRPAGLLDYFKLTEIDANWFGVGLVIEKQTGGTPVPQNKKMIRLV